MKELEAPTSKRLPQPALKEDWWRVILRTVLLALLTVIVLEEGLSRFLEWDRRQMDKKFRQEARLRFEELVAQRRLAAPAGGVATVRFVSMEGGPPYEVLFPNPDPETSYPNYRPRYFASWKTVTDRRWTFKDIETKQVIE